MDNKSLLEQRPDYLVCTCMGIMYSEIVTAIHNGCTTFKELSETLMVCSGCSSCMQEIYEILDNELKT